METLVEGADPHCELLIRMVGEDGTFYSPGEFLPIAERYHLMPQIDRWMVREALSIIARKGDDFSYICAINLSGQSLSDEGLLGYITAQLKEKSIDSRRICFEITETTVISDLDRARHLIDGLKELGCSFSLDDFGSGLSSFGYLKNLRVDYLKIDGMFVRNIATNTTDRAMVEAINHVGHVMKLHTIAEFAETAEIVQILRDMGVDYAQGYGVAKPEPFL
jgi:EAL domain-containing protein (putative c-di-GMP-specific phosphodiesterase class I)